MSPIQFIYSRLETLQIGANNSYCLVYSKCGGAGWIYIFSPRVVPKLFLFLPTTSVLCVCIIFFGGFILRTSCRYAGKMPSTSARVQQSISIQRMGLVPTYVLKCHAVMMRTTHLITFNAPFCSHSTHPLQFVKLNLLRLAPILVETIELVGSNSALFQPLSTFPPAL